MRKIKILAPILILGSVGAVTCSLASCSRSDHESLSFTSKNQILEYLVTNRESAGEEFTFENGQYFNNYNFISDNINFKVIQNGLLWGLCNKWGEHYVSFDVNLYVDHFDSVLKVKNAEGNIVEHTYNVSFQNKILASEGDVTGEFIINYDFNKDKYADESHYVIPDAGLAAGRYFELNDNVREQNLPISNFDWLNVDWFGQK